jgi:hypothetical protein
MIVAPEVSFAVLRDLTNQRLKEIGVSLGHRRQLLRAMAELTSLAREKKAPKPAVASAASAARAEHRQIFVMFLQSSELDGVLGANGP